MALYKYCIIIIIFKTFYRINAHLSANQPTAGDSKFSVCITTWSLRGPIARIAPASPRRPSQYRPKLIATVKVKCIVLRVEEMDVFLLISVALVLVTTFHSGIRLLVLVNCL